MSIRASLRNIYRRLFPIKVKGECNKVEIRSKARRSNFSVTIIGNNNSLEIAEDCRLVNTEFLLMGDNNHVVVEAGSDFDGPAKVYLEGNASLHVKRKCGIRGTEINIKNGTVNIGSHCMFSYGILIRNHDAHKVLNAATGEVINPPRDITIGDHVWLCQGCTILKGVTIGNDAIVAFGAVVTKDCPNNAITAGNPAQVVKTGINWLNK